MLVVSLDVHVCTCIYWTQTSVWFKVIYKLTDFNQNNVYTPQYSDQTMLLIVQSLLESRLPANVTSAMGSIFPNFSIFGRFFAPTTTTISDILVEFIPKWGIIGQNSLRKGHWFGLQICCTAQPWYSSCFHIHDKYPSAFSHTHTHGCVQCWQLLDQSPTAFTPNKYLDLTQVFMREFKSDVPVPRLPCLITNQLGTEALLKKIKKISISQISWFHQNPAQISWFCHFRKLFYDPIIKRR